MRSENKNLYQFQSLDAFYFSKLESSNILVHFDYNVIRAMAGFCYVAVLKDAIVGGFIFMFYKRRWH